MKESRYFVASRSAYAAQVDQHTTVLLDTQSGLFLGLNGSATAMWTLLTQEGFSLEEASRSIASTYRVPVEDVESDLDAFVATMIQRRLLSEGTVEPPAVRAPHIRSWYDRLRFPRPLEFVEATFTLRRMHTLLSRHGLSQASQYVTALPARHQVTATHPTVIRLSHLITQAARWQPFQARCLHQSFALAVMLRRRHLLAEIAIGVYTHPFTAHAWVESNRQIVGWEAGLGAYPDQALLQALTVIFRSSEVQP